MVKSDNYSVNMGNTQDKNDDFSKKANFDIHQHTQAMRNLQSNYTNSGYRINQPNLQSSARVTETEFRSVRRTASIYKPSVNIHTLPDGIKLELQYDSDSGSKLQIYIGVHQVDEDIQSKITKSINSELYFQQFLQAGKKSKFEKTYPLQGFTKIKGATIILRIVSNTSDERTEYSIKNAGQNNWKILLEKLQYNGIVTQLHNIYKGGSDSDECIICFTNTADTLIEPCNHLCLCYECCEHLRRSTNACPICRTAIKGFKKIRSTGSQ